VSNDLQAEIRFHLEDAVRARQQSEQDLVATQAKWEIERDQLKARIASMQRTALEVMEQANNPTRIALAVREKLERRLTAAKQDWDLQWESDRRKLTDEIDRLKKGAGISDSPKKDAAKRALLEKLGKIPVEATGPGIRTAAQIESEFDAARIQWETERQSLLLRATRAERDLQQSSQEIRAQVLGELRVQYEPQLATAGAEQQRLTHELASLTAQLNEERQRASIRIDMLEKALPAAKEAAKKQASAELRAEFDVQIEELNRLKLRTDRRFLDETEEWEAERRRARKQLAKLEEELKEAKEANYKSQRAKGEIEE
jgi:hypothetical protein